MPASADFASVIHKLLRDNDLPFRDFVELALYHPELGYYARRALPESDYITSPRLSPLFSTTLGKLVREFAGRVGDELSTIVDVGCGDGSLIHNLECGGHAAALRWYGVDRSLERLKVENRNLNFIQTFEEVPNNAP